jgi:hypothetical protein
MYQQVSKECEVDGTNELLAVQGESECRLLRVFTIKFPPWCLTMNSVDEIWVFVACEGIGNDLAFCVLNLAARSRGESAFWIGIPDEPIHIVAFEVRADEHLGLDVGR